MQTGQAARVCRVQEVCRHVRRIRRCLRQSVLSSVANHVAIPQARDERITARMHELLRQLFLGLC